MLGIALLCYPFVREKYEDHRQSRLIDRLEHSASTPSHVSLAAPLTAEYRQLAGLLDQDPEESAPQETSPALVADDGAIGIIYIDSIDAKLPILEGATKENMKYAATHLTETSMPGQPGNAAIAAHRARTKGRLFNRLGEVEIGDTVRIDTPERELVYTVFRIKVVEPDDLSVLEPEGDDAILTLITCDPLVNPTHRLIVQAHLGN